MVIPEKSCTPEGFVLFFSEVYLKKKPMNLEKPYAEVIATSISTWKAHCWDRHLVPAYGSLAIIQTGERTLFGLIYEIDAASLDEQRTVWAFGKDPQSLAQDQPQIFEFLKTTIHCLTLGYNQQNQCYYQLAPEPPKLHDFVHQPTREQLTEFFAKEHYLHTLFSYEKNLFSLDDLLLALIRFRAEQKLLNKMQFASFVDTFSLLTANDYRRLKLFLQRAQPLIAW